MVAGTRNTARIGFGKGVHTSWKIKAYICMDKNDGFDRSSEFQSIQEKFPSFEITPMDASPFYPHFELTAPSVIQGALSHANSQSDRTTHLRDFTCKKSVCTRGSWRPLACEGTGLENQSFVFLQRSLHGYVACCGFACPLVQTCLFQSNFPPPAPPAHKSNPFLAQRQSITPDQPWAHATNQHHTLCWPVTLPPQPTKPAPMAQRLPLLPRCGPCAVLGYRKADLALRYEFVVWAVWCSFTGALGARAMGGGGDGVTAERERELA